MQRKQENDSLSTDIQLRMALLQMANGYWISQSLYAAAKIGIADLLKDGSNSCDELARVTGVDSRSLYRLMRGLASVGVFAEQEPNYFSLTPLADGLRSDIPGSMRASVIMAGEEYYQAWGKILHSIRTGESAFEQLYGMQLFEYYAQSPESGEIFDEAMKSISTALKVAVVKGYDFSSISKLVDVGGGNGSLLSSILKANPTMQGILFDQASVLEGAKDIIAAAGVTDRCKVVAGDFFKSTPSGGDAYMLKYILHNWNDEQAIAILKNCHSVMPENGKLLVVEQVIPPGNEPFFGKLIDLHMLVALGGCERTENEYRELLEASGFHLSKIVPTRSNVSLIEAVKV